MVVAAAEAQSNATAGSTQRAFSQPELDQMLAPIALYPDALLAQILMASTYPLEVVSAARWVKANPNTTGNALESAMQKQTWDPSVKSLTAFPTVITMMNDKLEWTQQLGDAFLAQRTEVMNTVQALRHKAYAQGTLKTTGQQKVVVEKETIVIQPVSTVVYVPVYNPTVVYGAWWYPAYVPYYWYPPGYVAAPGLGFATGVIVGAALWGGVNWHSHDVNININHYNQFNHTTINSTHWQHSAAHRKGVAYRDPTIAQKYSRNQAADSAAQKRNRNQAVDSATQTRNRNQAVDAATGEVNQKRAQQAVSQRGPGRDRRGVDDDGPGGGGPGGGGPGGGGPGGGGPGGGGPGGGGPGGGGPGGGGPRGGRS
ncbi:MAG: DUF3300 domain-containing protein [Proteobacteria bacterium]|nr:DUF3300 domain-containing protein [Pseudomonadota bacterium]